MRQRRPGGRGPRRRPRAARLAVGAAPARRRPPVDDLTAVVTVADNGGSSGRLRGEFGVLPPGRPADGARRALRRRRVGRAPGRGCCSTASPATGEMHGHVVGNLLIVGLWELLGDHVRRARLGRPAARRARPGAADGAARRWTSPPRCAGSSPADPDALTDGARPGGGGHHRRAASTSIAPGPRRPAGLPGGASTRSRDADWVVLGPGSWFTSVIPHLMVPALRQALVETDARLRRRAQPRRAGGRDPGLRPRRPPRGRSLEHAPDLQRPHRPRRPRPASATAPTS